MLYSAHQMASFSSLSANLPSVTLRRPSNLVLDLPELLAYISRFLSQRDAVCCVLVCKAWFRAFEPIVWEHVETANNISPRDMERHAHEIKSLSLTGLQGLENVLRKCTRLETVILWPDAFEDEEDEDEEDEEVEDLAETEDECSLTAEAHAKHSGDAKGKGSDSSDAEGDGPLVVREADKEKVRRDSGIGEDTIGLVQTITPANSLDTINNCFPAAAGTKRMVATAPARRVSESPSHIATPEPQLATG
ncbi:hypothetical protein BGX28_007766 [Mortierella sp. GBA30]|nr:hypothetical protein BGX28_007766 [Mortierella sp. GBA30]